MSWTRTSRIPPAVSEPTEIPIPVRSVLWRTVTFCVTKRGNDVRAYALRPALIATQSSPHEMSLCSIKTSRHESGSMPSALGAYSGARIVVWCT